MARAQIVLAFDSDRAKAARWCMKLPVNTRVEFKAPKRTVPQNDRMWAQLTTIAEQVLYHGVKLTPEDFKLIFLDALKRETRMVPNLDGNGFVSLRQSSSDLSRAEMADLFLIIERQAAIWGVDISDPADVTPSTLERQKESA